MKWRNLTLVIAGTLVAAAILIMLHTHEGKKVLSNKAGTNLITN